MQPFWDLAKGTVGDNDWSGIHTSLFGSEYLPTSLWPTTNPRRQYSAHRLPIWSFASANRRLYLATISAPRALRLVCSCPLDLEATCAHWSRPSPMIKTMCKHSRCLCVVVAAAWLRGILSCGSCRQDKNRIRFVRPMGRSNISARRYSAVCLDIEKKTRTVL